MVLIFTDGSPELERLKVEVKKAELARDHVVIVSGRRNPEIVIFAVDSDSTADGIVEALKRQNRAGKCRNIL